MKNPILFLAEAIQNKQPAVLAAVVEVNGASPAKVGAPIGLNLGGPMPEEIAVSILAEVIAVRRGGRAARKSDSK